MNVFPFCFCFDFVNFFRFLFLFLFQVFVICFVSDANSSSDKVQLSNFSQGKLGWHLLYREKMKRKQ